MLWVSVKPKRASSRQVPLKTKACLLYSRPMRVPKEVRKFFAKVGAKGGKVTSPAKTAAVRANGKLGGRPKGSKNKVN